MARLPHLCKAKRKAVNLKSSSGGVTDPDMGGRPLTLDVKLIWAGDGKIIGDGPILN